MKLTPQQIDAVYDLLNETLDPGQADQVMVELNEPEPNPLGLVFMRIDDEPTSHRINTIGEVESHAREEPNG